MYCMSPVHIGFCPAPSSLSTSAVSGSCIIIQQNKGKKRIQRPGANWRGRGLPARRTILASWITDREQYLSGAHPCHRIESQFPYKASARRHVLRRPSDVVQANVRLVDLPGVTVEPFVRLSCSGTHSKLSLSTCPLSAPPRMHPASQ